jgi:hypothetical protein
VIIIIKKKKKKKKDIIGYPGPGWAHAAKLVNGIPTISLLIIGYSMACNREVIIIMSRDER